MPPQEILLTGATGYLGGYLLADLLDTTRARIHCLVRRRSSAQAQKELATALEARRAAPMPTHRIEVVTGNVAKPRLGIADDEYEALSERIDAVYHCGAWVNLVIDYRFLKGSNVNGTLEVLKFATHKRWIPLHHVSTLGVVMAHYAEGIGRVSESPVPPDPLPVGYYESKWPAERLVAQAGQQGLPVRIYRPGAVLGDSRTGFVSSSDWLMQLTLASLRVGLTPTHEFLLPVGCADATAACVIALSQEGAAKGEVFHAIHPEPMPLDTYFESVRRCCPHLRKASYRHWLDAIRTHYGQADPVSRLAEAVPRFLPSPRNGIPTHAANDQAMAVCGDRISAPSMDPEYFRRLLNALEQGGDGQ